VGLELGFGREAFSGRDIAPGIEGDVTPAEHLVGQVRPVREAGKIARAAGEQGVVAAAGRAIIGGRLQPFTQDRIAVSKAREYQEEEARIRKSIRTAEFKGNKERSVAMRATLLRLYDEMLLNGFEKEVPKWAQKRLQGLQQDH